jgi:hypothetical protein
VVVLGPPSLINWAWLKYHERYKILIFSVACTLFFAPAVELMARLTDAWDVASVFPRILGLIPIENMLFAFFNFFWVLSFYAFFIDKNTNPKFSHRFKFLVIIFIIFSTMVFAIFFIDKEIISLHYYQLALLLLLPVSIIIFIKYPSLLKKTIIPTLFFALVFFYYEIISLNLGHWWWPGQYLFATTLNGHIFPVDDVIIWYLLSAPALIGGYEFFADDQR